MIGHVSGTLTLKELDRVEVMTPGGVGYEIFVPIGVFEKLPAMGQAVSLHTHLVVKEDGWQLFGFANMHERQVFRRVLAAKGVGPALALAMLSALTAERLVAAIRDHDIATLQRVPRVGRRKAEQVVLDLADKMDDLAGGDAPRGDRAPAGGSGAEDAIRALVSLGYGAADSERAVRSVMDDEGVVGSGSAATELIRRALARLSGEKR